MPPVVRRGPVPVLGLSDTTLRMTRVHARVSPPLRSVSSTPSSYGTPTGAPRPAAAGGAWQGGGGHAGLAAHRGRPLFKGVLPNGPTPGEVLRFAAQRVLPGAEGPERRVDGAVHPGRERGRREQRRGACALWSVCWQRETDSAGVRRFVPVQCTSHDCCVYIAPN